MIHKTSSEQKSFPKVQPKTAMIHKQHFALLSGKSTYCVVAMAHKSTSHC